MVWMDEKEREREIETFEKEISKKFVNSKFFYVFYEIIFSYFFCSLCSSFSALEFLCLNQWDSSSRHLENRIDQFIISERNYGPAGRNKRYHRLQKRHLFHVVQSFRASVRRLQSSDFFFKIYFIVICIYRILTNWTIS